MDISISNAEKISSFSACILFVICFVYQLSYSEIQNKPGHFQQKLALLQNVAVDNVMTYMPPEFTTSCFTPLQKSFGHRNTSANQIKDLFRAPVAFDELFLSNTIAPALVNRRGFVVSEHREILNASELKVVVESLHPPSEIELLRLAKCQRCVVVGSGGCLRGRKLGRKIDGFPVVIRVNQSPIKGYKTDVGSRTDIRLLYPESAVRDSTLFEGAGIVVMVPFNHDDFLWIAKQARPSLKVQFSPSLFHIDKRTIPVDPRKMAVLNPKVKNAWYQQMMKEANNTRRRPTTGTIALLMALNLCKSVSIAGFCYNLSSPENYLYYYGNDKVHKLVYGTHDYYVDNRIRKKLLEEQLLVDLIVD